MQRNSIEILGSCFCASVLGLGVPKNGVLKVVNIFTIIFGGFTMISGVSDNFKVFNQPVSNVSVPGAKAVAAESAPALPADTLTKSSSDSSAGLIPKSLFCSSAAKTEEAANTSAVTTNSVSSWQAKWGPQVIYFPLTDRFSDGDPTNNFDVDKNNPTAYHGGDLRGVINNLDYIKGKY